VAVVGVFGTALGPVTMGSLIDRGLVIEQVCLLFNNRNVFDGRSLSAKIEMNPIPPPSLK
jgi:hypothetical protein